jgi:hypothetical protein
VRDDPEFDSGQNLKVLAMSALCQKRTFRPHAFSTLKKYRLRLKNEELRCSFAERSQAKRLLQGDQSRV